MNRTKGQGRGFGSNKGRQKGTPNKLTRVQKEMLASNLLAAVTPLELKFLLVMDTEKFIALAKLRVVKHALRVHGYTMKDFIVRHWASIENVSEFDQALKKLIAAPKGDRYLRTRYPR